MTSPQTAHLAMNINQLRSLAFALLAKREYSKAKLEEKLLASGADPKHVTELLIELSQHNYQNDARMAGMLVRSQLRQGRGPQRIQMALKQHNIQPELAHEELEQIDWFKQALMLKIKKFGSGVATDVKLKAKQIRFLQYRGFAMDIILKVVHHDDEEIE